MKRSRSEELSSSDAIYYPCVVPHCSRSFTSLQELSVHIAAHATEEPQEKPGGNGQERTDREGKPHSDMPKLIRRVNGLFASNDEIIERLLKMTQETPQVATVIPILLDSHLSAVGIRDADSKPTSAFLDALETKHPFTCARPPMATGASDADLQVKSFTDVCRVHSILIKAEIDIRTKLRSTEQHTRYVQLKADCENLQVALGDFEEPLGNALAYAGSRWEAFQQVEELRASYCDAVRQFRAQMLLHAKYSSNHLAWTPMGECELHTSDKMGCKIYARDYPSQTAMGFQCTLPLKRAVVRVSHYTDEPIVVGMFGRFPDGNMTAAGAALQMDTEQLIYYPQCITTKHSPETMNEFVTIEMTVKSTEITFRIVAEEQSSDPMLDVKADEEEPQLKKFSSFSSVSPTVSVKLPGGLHGQRYLYPFVYFNPSSRVEQNLSIKLLKNLCKVSSA